MSSWHRIADQALLAGRQVDLSGIGYGLLHDATLNAPFVALDPSEYYFFLAGFVRLMRLRLIVEIGTHMGGSARAMARGFGSSGEGRVITIDPTDLSDPFLRTESRITKIQGRAEDQATVKRVFELCANTEVDLLFIDGVHEHEVTMKHFKLYSELFHPRWVLFDDINLNDSMRACWQDVLRDFKGVDLSEVSPLIRQKPCGMGLVDMGAPVS